MSDEAAGNEYTVLLSAARARHRSSRVQIGSATHGGPAEFANVCTTCGSYAPCTTARLADAIEAVVVENAELRTGLDSRFEQSDHQSAKYYKRMRLAERERDALQARLDAMTVEFGISHIRPAPAGEDVLICRDEETWRRKTLFSLGRFGSETRVTRVVGPWAVVPEGEQA